MQIDTCYCLQVVGVREGRQEDCQEQEDTPMHRRVQLVHGSCGRSRYGCDHDRYSHKEVHKVVQEVVQEVLLSPGHHCPKQQYTENDSIR